MVNSKCNNSSLTMDASTTLTPLSSTRDAPFVIQLDDSSSTNSSRDGFAHKLRTKTSVLHSVPENRSVRAESNQSTQSQNQNQSYRPQQCPYLNDEPEPAKGEWNSGLLNCRKCSDVLMLACCPCIPAAKVHGLLGSSFESGVIYFGGLVFGLLISLGLCFSNSTSTMTSTSSPDGSKGGAGVGVATTVTVTTTSNMHIYGNLALVLLVLFLLGVAFLRTRARHRFNIPGSRAFDCVLSTVCCWCVLSQTQSHMEKHNRNEFGLETPSVDTLPAYT
ncbi:hypothetical protein Gpo141_00010962 [Globisporangium polare]